MLVSLILCFSDVLMQCYLHYYGPPEDSDAEEENNYPDLPVTTAGAVRSSSAAARDIQGLLSVSGYVSKMESDKGVNNNIINDSTPVVTDLEMVDNPVVTASPVVDPDRPRKEAIFDLAMRPESAVMPMPFAGDDSDINNINNTNEKNAK